MAQQERPLSPFLLHKNVGFLYRWQYTMALSILHRLTGVFLSGGIVLLVYWLLAAAAGGEAYGSALEVFAHPLVQLALFLQLLSFFYHLLNGIRHLGWDLGYGFEKAVAQKTGWLVFLGSLLLTGVIWALLLTHISAGSVVGGLV